MIKGRVIAIGDVHGCAVELEELLGLLAPGKDDYVLFLGDLVNRGPDTRAVLKIARDLGARSLLGNHELRLLEHHRSGNDSMLREGDQRTIAQLQPADWDYLEGMLLHHYSPELDIVFVHGGFLPGQAWQTQPASIVTRIQVIGPQNQPMKRTDAPPDSPSWADLWKGPPYVVYGHTPRPEVYERPGSLGIDTGCVMGGHLTALVLPERKIVQVQARRKYF